MPDLSENTDSLAAIDADADLLAGSMVLAEVLPGIAVVFGEVPAELKDELVDFGLVPTADRPRISTILATIGNSASVIGTLGTAAAGAQGLYRLTDTSRAVLAAGGRLAVKDGANLGGVFSTSTGKIIHQARFQPMQGTGVLKGAAGLGPVLAMVALEMSLDQVRYVRVATASGGGRMAVDLITRDENISWQFHADVDSAQVNALAAVLAETMTIPDAEREALLRGRPSVELDEGVTADVPT
ncbi:hypothetical protein JIG36_12990 [Actinoplanes sp. LDG1-06]|uniref:Uncharacterized protein n=1 Tax=Paractinoplanes ovalisporus TaxID=2810368 RepID=A0ABS2A9G3_9ACTN|nr:hypothetical protein [Actinoplanes ovalisporus]MBM2616473.1 hypothetical protein [Actinoplanes ovalisporus]